MMRFFNTMTRRKESFTIGKEVRIYTCGPTVYDFAHIGNFRTYLFQDMLRRYLKFKGFGVKQVMNITDVDDKTIKGSVKEGITLKGYTRRYTNAFFNDLDALRIEKAEFYPKATENIKEMIELVKILIKKGFAYKSSDGIYFDISKFKNYGKLANMKTKDLKDGARINNDNYTKDEAKDFALWKYWNAADGDVFWSDDDIQKGRPGWHIECSAMSKKYLGEIDIHSGGVDLIFPHHENEIAQSEAATGEKFARYWLHSEHLLVDGRKMSKSLNNFFTLRDIIEKGYDPIAFRYLCLSSHYRQQMNFTFKELDSAKKTLDNFNDFIRKVEFLMDRTKAKENEEILLLVDETKEKFEEHMDDDFNSPMALAAIFDLIKIVNKEIEENRADAKSLKKVHDFLMSVDKILDIIEEREPLTVAEKKLIEEREQARKKKDFKKADDIREKLKRRLIILEDTPYGPVYKKV
ncbi:MAG: cysteine--tRNA ligase [Candidatus Aenigmatarchaeota archaeon]